MKTASTIAVLALLAALSGCATKAKTAPPPQVEAPVLPISKMVHVPDLPGLPPPPLRDVALATAPPETPEPVHPHRTSRRKATQAKGTPAETPAPAGEKTDSQAQAANGGAAEVSPIGQLSSTGEGASAKGRQEIERSISDTENGLNNIKRTLTSDEQLTSTQIKTFLTRAKQALADNDLDGAQTLADKAKQLLQELIKK